MFFKVNNNITQFWSDLEKYRPQITSSSDVATRCSAISKEPTSFISHQVAFSKRGLQQLKIKDKLRDPHFDKGPMSKEKRALGDREKWDGVFKNASVHGVFVIAAKSESLFASKRLHQDAH